MRYTATCSWNRDKEGPEDYRLCPCVDPSPYGVIHRLAGDGSVKGTGAFCIQWALDRCGHMRIDTHPDNRTMQGLLEKLGFERRGIIHVTEDEYPRYAYEKVSRKKVSSEKIF